MIEQFSHSSPTCFLINEKCNRKQMAVSGKFSGKVESYYCLFVLIELHLFVCTKFTCTDCFYLALFKNFKCFCCQLSPTFASWHTHWKYRLMPNEQSWCADWL